MGSAIHTLLWTYSHEYLIDTLWWNLSTPCTEVRYLYPYTWLVYSFLIRCQYIRRDHDEDCGAKWQHPDLVTSLLQSVFVCFSLGHANGTLAPVRQFGFGSYPLLPQNSVAWVSTLLFMSS